MKEQDKDIEKLADRLMGYSELDTPTFNFRANILGQLELEKKKSVFLYKPLISNRSKWIIVTSTIVLLMVFSFSDIIDTNKFMNRSLNLNLEFLFIENGLPQIRMSSIVIYSSIFFAIIFCIQINSLLQFHRRFLKY